MSKKANKNDAQPKKVVAPVKQNKASNQKKQNKQTKQKKNKKQQNVAIKRLKETGSELRKVSWPTFARVIRQTGVVIAVVIMFTAVVFGIDRFLSWVFSLIIG